MAQPALQEKHENLTLATLAKEPNADARPVCNPSKLESPQLFSSNFLGIAESTAGVPGGLCHTSLPLDSWQRKPWARC